MKKIYSFIFILAAAWLSAVWFIGQETETLLSSQQDSGVKLLEYDNGFFGGTARFKVTHKFGLPQLDELFEHAVFDADFMHGPLTFSRSGFHAVSSHWSIRLDEQTLPKTTQSIFHKLFKKDQSVTGEMLFSFNESTNITLRVPEIILSEYNQKIGQIAPSIIKATLNRLSLHADIHAHIGQLEIQHPDGNLNIPVLNIQALLEDYLDQVPQGEMQVTLNNLHFSSSKLTEDIYLNLLADFVQQVNEDDLQGNLTVQITDAETPFQMIQAMTTNLKYTGLDRDVFGAELFDPTRFLQVLQQSFKEEASRIDLSMLVRGSVGKAELDGSAMYTKKSDKPLQAFDAHLDFISDKIYLDQSPLSILLFDFIETGVIRKTDNQYTFSIDLQSGDVDLNGKKVKVDKLSKFFGGGNSGQEEPRASKVGAPTREM